MKKPSLGGLGLERNRGRQEKQECQGLVDHCWLLNINLILGDISIYAPQVLAWCFYPVLILIYRFSQGFIESLAYDFACA